MSKKLLINLESPFAGQIELNTLYARFCMHDSIVNHGEAPYASHLLYTQPYVLDDDIYEERQLGIQSGLEFNSVTDKTVLYIDLGESPGMTQAELAALMDNREIERRNLPEKSMKKFWEAAVTEGLVVPHGDTYLTAIRPVGPPNRTINEDVPYVKQLAWVIPLILLGIIAYGIAESAGWFG